MIRRLLAQLMDWMFPVGAMVVGWREERDVWRMVAAYGEGQPDAGARLAMAVLTPDDPDLPEEAA